jgi:hypothetical protein
VIVSNLHPTVNTEDIFDIFGARLSASIEHAEVTESGKTGKTGTAEIVYNDPLDAAKAVKTYHSCELLGMNIQIVFVGAYEL